MWFVTKKQLTKELKDLVDWQRQQREWDLEHVKRVDAELQALKRYFGLGIQHKAASVEIVKVTKEVK